MESVESVYESVAEIIADVGNIPRETIQLDSHLFNDLGLDSLALLDSVFEFDSKWNITVPIEEWRDNINAGKAKPEDYFIVSSLCKQILNLIEKDGEDAPVEEAELETVD